MGREERRAGRWGRREVGMWRGEARLSPLCHLLQLRPVILFTLYPLRHWLHSTGKETVIRKVMGFSQGRTKWQSQGSAPRGSGS